MSEPLSQGHAFYNFGRWLNENHNNALCLSLSAVNGHELHRFGRELYENHYHVFRFSQIYKGVEKIFLY